MAQYRANGASFRELPPDAPCPRVCLVQKQNPTQEYGFNLHADGIKGQFIGTVDPGSPAALAGLRPNDRIFAVNGTSIIGNNHKEVVARIKSDPLKCELLVTSEEDFEWYSEHQVPIDMNLPNIIRVCQEFYNEPSVSSTSNSEGSPRHSARLIRTVGPPFTASKETSPKFTSRAPPSIDSGSFTSYNGSTTSSMRSTQESDIQPTKKRQSPKTVPANAAPMAAPPARISRLQKRLPTDEFGFNLQVEKGKGHYIGAVDVGGIADSAGIVMGQRIVGVNGVLITPNTAHNEVVGLIKRNPLLTELLVVSEELDRWYAENNRAFSFENAIRFNPAPEEVEPSPPQAPVPLAPPNNRLAVSNGKPPRQVMETRTVVEHQYMQPVSEENLVESEDVVRIISTTPAVDPEQGLEQVSTVSTTQTLKVIESHPPAHVDDLTNGSSNDSAQIKTPSTDSVTEDAHAATDNFIDQVFASVNLPRVTLDDQNNHVTAPTKELPQTEVTKVVASDAVSAISETNSNAYSYREATPSPKLPTTPVPTVIPQSTNRKPSPSINSVSTNSVPRSVNTISTSKHNGTSNGFDDIFKLSAKDARRALQRQKIDPRKQNLSIEEKHKMVANL
uniref:PDZ domain-containing protein n=1 Tax=Panagrellus redivivus TaxID=6233 RepID=A0A7E4VFM1_PANRE